MQSFVIFALSAKDEERTWFVVQEVREVFRCHNGKVFFRDPAEVGVSNTADMVGLLCMVNSGWVQVSNVNFGRAPVGLGCGLGDLINFFDDLVAHFLIERADSSLQESGIWHHVESLSRVKVTDRESEILTAVDRTRLNRVKTCQDESCSVYRVLKLVWC